jgi:hypothetical protein
MDSPSSSGRRRTLKLYGCLNYANEGLEILSPDVESQINLFDDTNLTDEKSSENSLAYNIANSFINLDSHYLSKQLTPSRLEVFFDDVLSSKRFIRNNKGEIVPVLKIHSKSEDDKRVIYIDSDKPFLNISELYTMSDLEYFSHINAYQICYCGYPNGRTRYEHFFTELIKFLNHNDNTYESLVFQVIQDTSPYLHIVSQYTISIIEVIIRMVSITNSRIKASSFSIRLDLRLGIIEHPVFSHTLSCFTDSEKIFARFNNGKIMKCSSSKDLLNMENESWSTKITEAHYQLMDSLENYYMMIDPMLKNTMSLKTRLKNLSFKEEDIIKKCDQLELVVAKISILLIELQAFIQTIQHNEYGYNKLYANVAEILTTLDQLEKEFPIIYGEYNTLNARTPRSQPRSRQDITTSRGTRSKSMDNGSPNRNSRGDLSATNINMTLNLSKLKYNQPDDVSP